MSAVGLSDLYRYGARFVGYGLVVTAAGGAFVAGGYVLGASDISTQAASNEALLGIAAGAIGVLLVLSGLVGLVYKLIADAVMAGTAAAFRTRAADVDAAATDESAPEEAQTEETETDDTAKPVPAGAPAADEPDAPATAETESTTEPAEPTVENPQPTAETEQVAEESQPTADAEASMSDDDGEEPAEPAAEAPPQAAPAVDDGADEPTAGDGADEPTDDQLESATAESVDLFEDAEGSEPTEAAERDAEAPPQEWSPPDPSEFERSESVEQPTDDAAESSSEDDQDDEFDGWDTAGTEKPESDADSPRTAADLFGDPEGGSSPEDGDEQSDKRLIDDGDVEEPADEETTLADEGVEGFDVDSDSDPLSDALDDE